MPYDKAQLMHGTLEGCILKIISQQTTYGYEILEYLKQIGFQDMAEGTIYPLLLRLEKQGSIRAELRPSPLGPKRKYFSITPEGKAYLAGFEASWQQMSRAVSLLMEETKPDTEVER